MALIFWSSAEKFLDVDCSGVAESKLHKSMKAIVRRELESERYAILEEPLNSPMRRLSWIAYRPDLLGYRRTGEHEEIALVECETHPSTRKLVSKNYQSVWFQPYLFREGSVRRVLAVPQGKLHFVDMAVRREWEIWVLGRREPISKISSLAVLDERANEEIPVSQKLR